MAVPAFLTGDLIHQVPTSISDVQDIIDDFRTLAVTLSPAWTDEGGDLFTSPVDGDGRFFDILFTRIDADTLEMRVRDDTGTTIMTRRMDIVAGPVNWWMTITQYMVWIEMQNVIEEAFGAGILDLSPEGQIAHSNYVWCRGSRATGGSIDVDGDTHSDFFILDNGVATSGRRVISRDRNHGLVNVLMVTGGGNDRWGAVELMANFSGTNRYAGRLYQVLYGTSNGIGVVIPTGDSGETGTFRASGLVADGFLRLMVRTG